MGGDKTLLQVNSLAGSEADADELLDALGIADGSPWLDAIRAANGSAP